MRKLKVSNIWISAFLLAALVAGCSDSDKNANAGNPSDPLTPPTVTSVTPAAGSTLVCPTPLVITATFSKAMNPATIDTTTFTLTAGGTSVPGSVSYAAATNTATFTVSATLAASTTFTATITTGAKDTFGNALAANFTWTFTTPAQCPPPTVTSVTPLNGSTLVCPNTALITATFSHTMNPATINTTTFTLAGTGGASVAGTVSYNVATRIATFTPSATLPSSATFTATITTGVQDTSGIAMAPPNFVWTFTTSPPCPPPPPPSAGLGAACTYGVLAATTVTNTGATLVTGPAPSGDLGLSPGTSVTGFANSNTYVGTGTHTAGLGIVSGIIHLTDPPPPSTTSAAAAQAALTVAYNDLAGRTVPAPTTVAGDLGGLTLAPGLYKSTSTLGITGTLTLDGQGNANAVWIFQIASSLTTLGTSNVVLAGGASAHNIFWQVGSSATLGTNSTFNGSILALTSVTLTTGATLNGRALAQNGAVTLDTNMVNVPTCP
jgi:Ice-binding-like/Bacterial Ig-like domain